MKRRSVNDEDRLLKLEERYSKTAKALHQTRNKIAAKKLRAVIDKNSPVAATIRALKGLLKTRAALEGSLLSEDSRLAEAVQGAVESLNSAIKKETGVDIELTFKVRPGKGDDAADDDPTPEMFPEEPVPILASHAIEA